MAYLCYSRLALSVQFPDRERILLSRFARNYTVASHYDFGLLTLISSFAGFFSFVQSL